MSGPVLTSAAVLLCPHGGSVLVPWGSGRAHAAGQPLLSLADPVQVAGCPADDPCQRVEFLPGSQRVRLAGLPVLTSASPGLCLTASGTPQGEARLVVHQLRVTVAG